MDRGKGGVMSKNNLDTPVKKQVEASSESLHKSKKRVMTAESEHTSKFPVFAFLIVLGLLLVSVWFLLRQSKFSTDATIVQDIQILQQIFRDIDKDCKIIDFEHTKNYVDFLTVKEFVGSQIGAMNLTYPQNWKGPYVKHNLKVHEQQYLILKNKKGYYLVPGDGVVLANGQTIGLDIVLNEKSDIESLLQDPQGLKSSQGLLAAKIEIGGTYFKKVLQAPLSYMTLEG